MRFAKWVIGALLLVACMGQDFGGGALDGDGPTDALGGSTSVVGRGPYAGDPTAIWDTAPSGSDSWGPTSLPSTITINGVTETAVFRYLGQSASLSGWTAAIGDDLPLDAEVGTGSPDFDQPGPWTDGSLGLTMGAGDYVFGSASANDGAIADGDWALECVLTIPPTGSERHLIGRWRTSTTPYWSVYFTPVGNLAVITHDGTTSAASSAMGSGFVVGSKVHLMIFADRSGSAYAYVDGAQTGNFAISAAQGSLNRSATKFMIGTYDSTGTGPAFASQIDMCQAWHRASWMDTGAQASVALARFNEYVAGLVSTYAGATVLPSTSTRNGAAYARICDPSTDTTRAYLLGKHWIARERSCDGEWLTPTAAVSSAVSGPLVEAGFSNLALQSSDLATTWATVNATIDVNQAVDPAGSTTMDDIDGSASDLEHGVSQAITLTANDHTWSAFARPGNQTFAYLDVSTITNAWAYFNLDTCRVTSEGVAAVGSTEFFNDASGDTLCRIAIGFIGTAASHTVRALCAQADGDKVYTGAAGDCAFGWMQVSNAAFPGSYVATTTTSAAKVADDLRWTLTARNPDQTTIIVDGFWQNDGFDTTGVYPFAYTDGGSATEIITAYTITNATRGQWYDGTTNVTVTRAMPTSTGERHILRYVTDVATTSANVCVDGVCSSSSSLSSVGTDYDTFTFASRTGVSQPHANFWRVRLYDVAALPD